MPRSFMDVINVYDFTGLVFTTALEHHMSMRPLLRIT